MNNHKLQIKLSSLYLKVVGAALASIAILGAVPVAAQAAVGTVPASATVVAPLVVSEPADLRFGTFAPNTTAGTVVLVMPATLAATQPTTAAPTLSGTRTATGGVVLVGGGTCSATVVCGVGSLQVVGPNNASFSQVILPASVTLTSGANSMTVNALNARYGAPSTAGATSGATTFSATGRATVMIAGTLAVGVSQAAGTYTGNVSVTVDY